MIIVLSSFVALAYNITHNFLLQRTSAVTVTVLGEVKIVGLLLLSAIILPGSLLHKTLGVFLMHCSSLCQTLNPIAQDMN